MRLRIHIFHAMADSWEDEADGIYVEPEPVVEKVIVAEPIIAAVVEVIFAVYAYECDFLHHHSG